MIPSDGEVIMRPPVHPERDPMIALLTQIQKQPVKYIEQQLLANQRRGLFQAAVSGGEVSRSLGEVGSSRVNSQSDISRRPGGVTLVKSRSIDEEASAGMLHALYILPHVTSKQW